MKKSSMQDTIVFGFAMFAMFFGAGNLIFPPVLGMTTGSAWFVSFLGFFVMDAGLAVLGVLTMLKVRGEMLRVGESLGKRVSILLSVVTVLCIGPCLGIPRTGAVAFSMSAAPLLHLEASGPLPLLLFSILFYAVVLILSIKPNRVVNVVGALLTPALLVCLLVMIGAGIINGRMQAAEVLMENPLGEGISNGYQTMDGMASLLFSGMMIQQLLTSENGSESQSRAQIVKASLLAGTLLFVVYGGLTWLGRVWGLPYCSLYLAGELDSAELLTLIVEDILGRGGVYVICIVAFFACLTTAVGLTSGVARFFETLLKGRLSYRTLCIVIACVGCGFCNFGLSQIITIAAPVLEVVYPPITVLIALGLFREKLLKAYPWCLGTGTAFLVSCCSLLCDTCGLQSLAFVHLLPLDACGLGFVLPSVLSIALGLLLTKTHALCADRKQDAVFGHCDAETL